jgi:hypothetical protein
MLTPNNLGVQDYGAAAYFTWTDASGTEGTFYPDLVISEVWENNAQATEHPVEQGANVIDHVRVELVKCSLTIFATNEPIGANWLADPGPPQTVALTGPESAGTGTYPVGSVEANQWNANLALRGAFLAAGDLTASIVADSIGGVSGGLVGGLGILGLGLLEGLLLGGSSSTVSVPVTAGSLPAPQVQGGANVMFFDLTQDFVQATIQQLIYLKNTVQVCSVFGSKQQMPSMVIEGLSYTRSEDEGTGATIVINFKELRLVQTQTVNVPLPTVPSAASTVAKGNQNPSDATPAQQNSVAEELKNFILSLVSPPGPSLP